ncbi:cob(I)yrinic acid a,c-diamide adenosyltransferase [Marinobacterium arenosum]|uniref:cob(I)yrinic acid a,c-diamide adenosyltransferase n=1 Tax=Marinobacterium arenosum TaxID=2862496 RepID=UPI001C971EF9|nr:cob(I)yrinic acid a,c-diamide adenosyltransferase [Marinobacterium arenosum]MBY4678598.1 cob(I)yrinic acid a,c-diamide adenosyltransferase [Marinobacterium arenosum]
MANRLTRIYTRTGDKGQTGLGGGKRVAKFDVRIEAMGDIDELNSQLGVVIALLAADDPLRDALQPIQHRLFDLGGEIAMDSDQYQVIEADDVSALEQLLDRYNADLPSLKEFILPGGSPAAAHCHLARTVCRRAERKLHKLAAEHGFNPQSVGYVNRLSDLLFVVARLLARRDGGQEILWQPKPAQP